MNNVYRRSIPFLMATVFGTGVLGMSGVAIAQNQADPPARVGRLAFTEGTVSFHDAQDTNWSAAAVNDTLTSGDSLWTEPNSRSELSVAGTRVRLDQSTQVDLLRVDDSATRLQLDQGRIDIKTYTMDTAQPYEIVTPRGLVKLEGQGDYYIESGTSNDPTRLGVRSGAAQITGMNGQTLAVRAGEVGEISGDAASPQLHTVKSAPPPQPQYWAQRDQQITYDTPQYLSGDVVGYEDMQAYGGWSNDPDYGQVWSPNQVPVGWQPYSTGQWAYSQPYGWTWVDEQPWGFAPYHYGRWAHRNDRWFWVPPERRERAVYAPALVAFVGGTELSLALGSNSGNVGWFPLGPREAYVPPYTNDRSYYERINTNARVERAIMDERWQRAERREAIRDDQQRDQWANRRFATVVPAQAFVSSQRVERAAIKVSADNLAKAPVAAVSAPPSPMHSIMALKADDPRVKEQADIRTKMEADAKAHGNLATANTRFNGVQELARPAQAQRAEQQHQAPGPKIVNAAPNQPNATAAKPNLPQLEQRNGAPQPPNSPQANRPGEPNRPNDAQRPGEPNRPNEAQRPGEPNRPNDTKTAEPPRPGKPGEPAKPQGQQANRPEPPKPGAPQQPHQAEAPRAPNQPAQAPQTQRAEPPHPAENHAAPPPQAQRSEPPRAPEQHQAQQPQHVEPPHQAAAPPAQPQHMQAPPPQAQHQAPAAPPPQAQQQHAAPPAPPQQAQHPAPAPQAAPQAPHPAAPPQQAQSPHPGGHEEKK